MPSTQQLHTASHLSMPAFRKHIQQLFNGEAETKYGQQSTHLNATRGPRPSTNILDIRMKALVARYNGDNMIESEYLRSAGHLYQ